MGIHVSLPSEMEAMVHEKVKTGMYGSASEVIREALRGFFGKDEKDKPSVIPELTEAQLEKFLEPIIADYESGRNPVWGTWEEFEAHLDKITQDFEQQTP